MRRHLPQFARRALRAAALVAAAVTTITATPGANDRHDDDDHQKRRPKVVVISLDGARPDLVERYLRRGVLDWNTGLGRIKKFGVSAAQNVTATPSVTAVSHVAIATGSTAPHNDISGNSFHPIAATIGTSLSGFGAPIGGYQFSPLGPAALPTAEPLWVQLRNGGRKVVTATWPGGDGADVKINGVTVQTPTPTRVVDYTVPFGAFGGLGAVGFTLSASNFALAPQILVDQIEAAGRHSYSPVMVTTAPIETFFCDPNPSTSPCGAATALRTIRYDIMFAALDLKRDWRTNYDTLVFFDLKDGIKPGPFALPATGPAYARLHSRSARFFFELSGSKVGTSFYVNRIEPDLSIVRFARYGANFIPRSSPVPGVLANVDDINGHVGFWVSQPDFRIPERLGTPTFNAFSDLELEAIYEDQVKTFVEYQTKLARRAIRENSDADLVMVYLEQPDGSGHQFTLTDPRQASNPADPTTIDAPAPGATGQDQAKVARYAKYLEFAYRQASQAVEKIVQTVGVDRRGEPLSDIFVVSDHGMAPFHTAVNLSALLSNAGVNTSQIGIRTTGPATNIYVNLAGREPGGTVAPGAFQALVDQIANVLRNAVDPNPYYNPSSRPLFTDVWTRPSGCVAGPGFCTNDNIGQDTGDILALMSEGYNFDGAQSPLVVRLGDAAGSPYSVPNFYGAHGHNSELPSMSAIFYAAGPHIVSGRRLKQVRNIDVAPTILDILGLTPGPTVDGRSLTEILRQQHWFWHW